MFGRSTFKVRADALTFKVQRGKKPCPPPDILPKPGDKCIHEGVAQTILTLSIRRSQDVWIRTASSTRGPGLATEILGGDYLQMRQTGGGKRLLLASRRMGI